METRVNRGELLHTVNCGAVSSGVSLYIDCLCIDQVWCWSELHLRVSPVLALGWDREIWRQAAQRLALLWVLSHLAACSNLHPVGLSVSKLWWLKRREVMRWQKFTLSGFCKEQWGLRKDLYKLPRTVTQQYALSILSFTLAISPHSSRKGNKVQRMPQPFLLFQDSYRNDCNLCSEQTGHCNDLLRWRTEAGRRNASCPRPPWMPSAETEIKLRSPGSQSWVSTIKHSLFLPSDSSGWIGQYLPFWNTARQHAGNNCCEKRQGSVSACHCLDG